MRHPRSTGLAAALLVIATSASAATAARHRERIDPDLQPAGKAVDCITESSVENTTFPDDRTIDFHMRTGEIYRNTLPQSCPNLSRYRAFTHRTSLNQYCSGDTITVFLAGATPIPGATCGLGSFQPMEKPGTTGK